MKSEAQFHGWMTPVTGLGDGAFFFADPKASLLDVLKGSVTLKDSHTMLIAVQAARFTTGTDPGRRKGPRRPGAHQTLNPNSPCITEPE